MKIIKDDRILEVTVKAYNVIFKGLGYKPYTEPKPQPKRQKKED